MVACVAALNSIDIENLIYSFLFTKATNTFINVLIKLNKKIWSKNALTKNVKLQENN